MNEIAGERTWTGKKRGANQNVEFPREGPQETPYPRLKNKRSTRGEGAGREEMNNKRRKAERMDDMMHGKAPYEP